MTSRYSSSGCSPRGKTNAKLHHFRAPKFPRAISKCLQCSSSNLHPKGINQTSISPPAPASTTGRMWNPNTTSHGKETAPFSLDDGAGAFNDLCYMSYLLSDSESDQELHTTAPVTASNIPCSPQYGERGLDHLGSTGSGCFTSTEVLDLSTSYKGIDDDVHGMNSDDLPKAPWPDFGEDTNCFSAVHPAKDALGHVNWDGTNYFSAPYIPKMLPEPAFHENNAISRGSLAPYPIVPWHGVAADLNVATFSTNSGQQIPLLSSHPFPAKDQNPTNSSRLENYTHMKLNKAIYQIPLSPEVVPNLADVTTGFITSSPRWVLDQYISCLGTTLQRSVSTRLVKKSIIESAMAEGILWAVREGLPGAAAFWKVTASFNGFLQVELWRNFPCRASYNMLHPVYRPTKMQLCVPHSPTIDWLPWPELRDLVIMYQDKVDLDAVCKAAILNVVSHRRFDNYTSKSKRQSKHSGQLVGLPSFRTWDLCLLEEQSDSSISAPSLRKVAEGLQYKPQSPSVLALEKAYGLVHDDFSTQRLHPAFFELYPFLYCKSAVSEFCVQEIPTVVKQDIGRTKPLGTDAVGRLASLFEEKLGKL